MAISEKMVKDYLKNKADLTSGSFYEEEIDEINFVDFENKSDHLLVNKVSFYFKDDYDGHQKEDIKISIFDLLSFIYEEMKKNTTEKEED